ncbi:MAG: TIGR00153 family protein [Bacteroidetes Order II. Incertae sedis bacterium]|jgi:uncharacterized protein|nr:TIGR00153 family protein [Bacteroidetes Order II. bacterium]MDG1755585.1 TIGR00153 family protein [Rhodothermales bacterium]HAY37296.1 TIGR00153 family protein [Bacteroidota bacterium]MBT4052356.1 TIGR00153 family protein [Bacteroidetes Order II. bacterium]MBT4602942.1 TIGR00153 family protein [Bacteroidetes Order II. bacterium]
MLGTSPLSRLFGKNPFSLLKQHMRVSLACAEELPDLFKALEAGDQAKVAELKDSIFKLEADADLLHREVRQNLPRTFMLPVNRRDLLDLLEMQDKIADVTQDIVGLLFERQMALPEGIKDHIHPYVEDCLNVVRHGASIIEEMDELLETGFSGPEADKVSAMIDELNTIEDQSDESGIAISSALFKFEDQMNPVSVIFWHRLIEWIGDTADYAEAVGNRLRLMISAR